MQFCTIDDVVGTKTVGAKRRRVIVGRAGCDTRLFEAGAQQPAFSLTDGRKGTAPYVRFRNSSSDQQADVTASLYTAVGSGCFTACSFANGWKQGYGSATDVTKKFEFKLP